MKLKTAPVFRDHMVLQRDRKITVWGEAEPGSSVRICVQDHECSVQSDEDGKWKAVLPELKTSVNETLEIHSGKERLLYTDILIGEVWLAGEQSNMELNMFYDSGYASALEECENPMIRFFDVSQITSEEHVKRNDDSLYGFWKKADKENLKYFSAVGYYFAKALQEDLKVPVGMIGCDWESSRNCCRMVRETIIPFTLRGMICFQDVRDEDHPDMYADLLEAQIRLWRKEFGQELPFLMTQLVPRGEEIGKGGKFFPALREQQEMAAARLADVWCASTGDAGDYDGIHPKWKHPVGTRLALLARGHVYGESILCDAPEGIAMYREGHDLVIECSGAEGGLYLNGHRINALQIFEENGQEVSETACKATVQMDQLRICFSGGLAEGPYMIRFAKTPYYNVNLYNIAGIPMKPFELTETL